MSNSFFSINNLLLASGFSKKSVACVCVALFWFGFGIGNFISKNKEGVYEIYAMKPGLQNYLAEVEYIEPILPSQEIVQPSPVVEQVKIAIAPPTDNEKTFVKIDKPSMTIASAVSTAPVKKDVAADDLKIYKKRVQASDPAWKRNALEWTAKKDVPMIAIIIDDMGLDVIRSNRVLEIDAPITTSYMAYAVNLRNQIANAKKAGKEIMMHIPMQAKSETYDEGPDVLKDAYSSERLQAIMKKQLAKSDEIVGVNNHMGSKFTDDFAAMNAVLAIVKDAGLLFVDSKTSAKSVGVKVANALSLPNVARDIFLDNHPSEKEVEQQLEMLERFAKRKGYAVAIGHPRDDTINVLRRWVRDVESRGFQIVPVSAIIKHNM